MKATILVSLCLIFSTIASAAPNKSRLYFSPTWTEEVTERGRRAVKVEDQLEVTMVDPQSLSFSVMLNGPGQHMCMAGGLAKKSGGGYTWTDETAGDDGQRCVIDITLVNGGAVISGNNCETYCGARARGMLNQETIFKSSRANQPKELECGGVASPGSKATCAVLRAEITDRRLNTAYQILMKRLSPNRAEKLRQEQRQWIAKRNADCGVFREDQSGEENLKVVNCYADRSWGRSAELEGKIRATNPAPKRRSNSLFEM